MQKSIALALAGLAAQTVLAAPTYKRQDSNIDVTVLQFALTLEHLENVFYKQALQKFTAQDFINYGLDADYYTSLQYVASDEQTHVQFLTTGLQSVGAAPVAACTYNFPYTDVAGFLGLSTVLEGVGTSAYLGAAPLITSKDYLTAAGSILVDEALHTSLQRISTGLQPSANPFGTPLEPNSVFTLAAQFIVECPPSNAALPFTGYPLLSVKAAAAKRDWSEWTEAPAKKEKPAAAPLPKAGDHITFTSAKAALPANTFVTFVSGLSVISVPGTVSGQDVSVEIPAGVSGQSYVFASSRDVETTFDATAIVAGPAIIEVAPPAPAIDYSILKA